MYFIVKREADAGEDENGEGDEKQRHPDLGVVVARDGTGESRQLGLVFSSCVFRLIVTQCL